MPIPKSLDQEGEKKTLKLDWAKFTDTGAGFRDQIFCLDHSGVFSSAGWVDESEFVFNKGLTHREEMSERLWNRERDASGG